MKKSVDVSIIAANYNNAPYLKDFLNSIVNSSLLPKEVILVDDGSTDDSGEILNQYIGYPFIHIIRFKTNKGFTTALNTALEAASGKYIMRADPDDIFTADRIGKQVRFMEENPEVGVLGTNVTYFRSSDGKRLNTSNFPLSHHTIYKRFFLGGYGVQHPTVCVRGEVYKQYRYQAIFPGEDYELFARMIRDGHRFANLAEPLYLMRIHKGSSTSNIKYKEVKQCFRFRDHIFGTRTTQIKALQSFLFIRFYRKAQLSSYKVSHYLFLFLATLFAPSRLFGRLLR